MKTFPQRLGRLVVLAVCSLTAVLVPAAPVAATPIGWAVGTGSGTVTHTADGSTWYPRESIRRFSTKPLALPGATRDS